MHKFFLAIITLFTTFFLNGQSDTVYNYVDTIVSEKVEVDKIEYQKVASYFFINAGYSYNVDKNVLWCEGNQQLFDGFHNSTLSRLSHCAFINLSHKINQLIYSAGIKVYNFQESQMSSNGKLAAQSNVSNVHFFLSLGQKYKFKSIAAIPTVGISILAKSFGESNYLTYSEKTKTFGVFTTDNYFKKGSLHLFVGTDIQFFRKNRISPYLGLYFSKGITRETDKQVFLRVHKFNFMPTVGMYIKF